MVIQRLPVELSGCVIGLRKQRLALEQLFAEASTKGDSAAACRVSDSLVKIAQAFHQLGRETRTKRGRSFAGEYPVPVEAQVIGPADSLERVG